ncbi:hypothetical protein IQ07DRAFT_652273 [Pyrenochaeta sp. DS3sAY3a]|nr:hypothetical protein IQ07DRAFT_652273 [Pyrenochaeta sp. DS3sAY3a]
MFRCVEGALPPDPIFKANLKDLGFFVNNGGCIRMIEAPEQRYKYYCTNSERVNEVFAEAFQTNINSACQREEAEKRLSALGLSRIYLPSFSTTKPDGPHVPILAPAPSILKTRKRVIVLINNDTQDLGILSYGQLQGDLGVNGGSVVNFVKEIITNSVPDKYKNIFADGEGVKDDEDVPALIVMNPGQLLYSHKLNRAMSMKSWTAMPRKSMLHDMVRIHETQNHIKAHHNSKEHISSVFNDVLCNTDRVAANAEVYVIAIENGADNMLAALTDNFKKISTRLAGMALVHSLMDDSQIKDPDLRTFLHQRTRQWNYCDRTVNPYHCIDLPNQFNVEMDNNATKDAMAAEHISWSETIKSTEVVPELAKAISDTIADRRLPKSEDSSTDVQSLSSPGTICPTFAGGDCFLGESVFTQPLVRRAILSFFEEIGRNPTNYKNPTMTIYTNAPQPTADKPLELSGEAPDDGAPSFLPEITLEQAYLDEARETLTKMRVALDDCPSNVEVLKVGREKLIKKINKKEMEIEELAKKALSNGGLKAGEAQDLRENWKPQKEGKMVPFAGTMIDSELLRAAGMLDTAKEELEKLELDGDQKAFL